MTWHYSPCLSWTHLSHLLLSWMSGEHAHGHSVHMCIRLVQLFTTAFSSSFHIFSLPFFLFFIIISLYSINTIFDCWHTIPLICYCSILCFHLPFSIHLCAHLKSKKYVSSQIMSYKSYFSPCSSNGNELCFWFMCVCVCFPSSFCL